MAISSIIYNIPNDLTNQQLIARIETHRVKVDCLKSVVAQNWPPDQNGNPITISDAAMIAYVLRHEVKNNEIRIQQIANDQANQAVEENNNNF